MYQRLLEVCWLLYMALVGLSPASNMEPDLDVKSGTNLGTKLGETELCWIYMGGGLSPLTNMGAAAPTLASQGLIWRAVIFCLPPTTDTANFSRESTLLTIFYRSKHVDENISLLSGA